MPHSGEDVVGFSVSRLPRLGVAGPSPARMSGLDAARGLAMLLVCAAHFAEVYFPRVGHPEVASAVRRLTYAATPSFILISGVLLGVLQFDHRAAFDGTRRKLVDRALFLLTVAHFMNAAAYVSHVGMWDALLVVHITDVVACCVLVGTFVVAATSARTRASFAIALYLAATLVHFRWLPPVGSTLELLKHLFVGYRHHVENNVFRSNFPIAQWTAAYLLATVVGGLLARSRAQDGRPRIASLVWLGAGLMTAGAFLRASRAGLARLLVLAHAGNADVVAFLTGWWQKFPPGSTYLLVYGGLALILVAGCLWLDSAHPSSTALRAPALLGRNSLFVFVAQQYVYSLVYWLHLPFTRLWPMIFVSTVLLLGMLTVFWHRRRGHRLLTVGYPGLVARLERWWPVGVVEPARGTGEPAGRLT